MHKALYRLCVEVYYGKSQKLLGNTSEFKDAVPPATITLVAAAVCCYKVCS